MKGPGEIGKKLLEKWDRGFYFKKGADSFPLSVSLGTVTSRDMIDGFDQVRHWIGLYRDNPQLSPFLEWEEVDHRKLGRQRIPRRLTFDRPEDLAGFLNRRSQWEKFTSLRDRINARDRRLGEWARQYPLELLRIAPDLDRLMMLWKWMLNHPRPRIYLRQIDIPGIDTKFTETYRKVLSDWLDLTLPDEAVDRNYTGVSGFESRYGFKGKPELIRFRFLDPALEWRGCSDISLPAGEFCRLYSPADLSVRHVFVVENDITALSFPPVEKGMVVFGRGYHFDHWKECSWLREVSLHYWGDLDTHGFRILDQFRSLFPHARSFLMDRRTLLEYGDSWGEEPSSRTGNLSHLTSEESELYDDLRFNRIRTGLRLEQEFVRISRIREELEKLTEHT
ncbi:MAG: hypothetical protein JXA95_13795 [Spirochaetales bacterium]|nr:hypothetical protein [Spirochaetales bacterium]